MNAFAMALRLRQRLYLELDPAAWPHRGLSPLNRFACALIVLSALLAILETEPEILRGRERLFVVSEWVITAVFVAEYLARLWVCVDNPRYGPGLKGRLRYAVSAAAIINLLAVAPVLLALAGSQMFLLRLFRLLRILRLARLGRFSRSLQYIGEAISMRRYELGVSFGIAMLLLVVASSLLYVVEGEVQPTAFGSIPRAMWWAIATLTTVGYGDVYPVTALGRVLAAVTALAGIGLIAMPTGILAAAFGEALRRRENSSEGGSSKEP